MLPFGDYMVTYGDSIKAKGVDIMVLLRTKLAKGDKTTKPLALENEMFVLSLPRLHKKAVSCMITTTRYAFICEAQQFTNTDTQHTSTVTHYIIADTLQASTATHYIITDTLQANTATHYIITDKLQASTATHYIIADTLQASTATQNTNTNTHYITSFSLFPHETPLHSASTSRINNSAHSHFVRRRP